MSNRRNIQFTYNPHNKGTLLDCSFIVDHANSNGFGVSSLNKSGRIASVFMHTNPAAVTTTSVFASGVTSVTVASVTGIRVGQTVTDSTTGGNISGGTKVIAIQNNVVYLNQATAGASASSPGDTLSFVFGSGGIAANGQQNTPNPANGLIVVTLQDNYNAYLSRFAAVSTPLSGTPISISSSSVLTIGNPYVITSVGTTTTAQWQAVGLAPWIKPAVGVSFIASVTGSGTGSGVVQAPASAASGVDHFELIGDPNLMNNSLQYAIAGNPSGNAAFGIGMQFIIGCYGKAFNYNSGTPANSTVTNALVAPADNSLISLAFYMNDSAQGV